MTRNLTRSLLTLGRLAACSVPTLAAAEEWQTALKAQAKVTEAKAQKTALAKVPGGSIKSSELEKERGKLIWSFDIAMPKSRNVTEVQVDAKTGKVVSTQIETPADQAKEATADEKAKK
jgi:Peptidase propeptide and YPEB domain